MLSFCHEEDKTSDFNILDFSEMLRNLHNIYGDDIENQFDIKSCIDVLFVKCKPIMQGLFIIYLLFFCLPFFLQIFVLRDPFYIRLCNVSCLMINIV